MDDIRPDEAIVKSPFAGWINPITIYPKFRSLTFANSHPIQKKRGTAP